MIAEMGMTDKQWKGWLRRLKRDLEELKENKDEEKRQKKLDEMLEDIQQDLEDWIIREGGLATALYTNHNGGLSHDRGNETHFRKTYRDG